MAEHENTITMRTVLLIFLVLVFKPIYAQDILIDNQGILKAQIKDFNETIEILNEDGTIWMKFGFDYEKRLSDKTSYTMEDVKKLYEWQDSFHPYFFKLDYALLLFKCVEIEKDRYKIVVNEVTNETKYIKKKESLWILENWSEHILNTVVSIDFDFENNPIKLTPTENSENLKLTGEIECFYPPLEIKNEWLKINITEDNIEKTGWVRWKKDNKIIISLDYLI